MDYLVGVVNHHSWADICCWYRSARKHGFLGTVVLICYDDTSNRTIRRCRLEGIQVIEQTLSGSLLHQRYRDIEAFTAQLPAQAKVLTTDVRDVVFQGDISVLLERVLDENDLYIWGEGWTYRDSEWNRNDLLANVPSALTEMLDKQIYCCGVLAGKAGKLQSFCRIADETLAEAKTGYCDQAAINVLLQSKKTIGLRVGFGQLEDGGCVHFGVLAQENIQTFSRCALGEMPRFDWQQKKAVRHDGSPYMVLHQYTKIPSVRRCVLVQNKCLLPFYVGKLFDAIEKRLPWTKRQLPFWKRPEVVSNRISEN